MKIRYNHPLFILLVGLILFLNASVALAQSQNTVREATGAGTAQQQTGGIDLIGQIGGTLTDIVIQGDYAYLGVGARVVVVDISTSARPTFVGQSGALPRQVNALAVKNNHVYAIAGNTLYVFGIHVQSAHNQVILTRQGAFQGPSGYTATDVVVEGNTAYVTFATGGVLLLERGLLEIIDVSNPAVPTLLGSDSSNYHPQAVALSGNDLYVGGGNLVIYDVSDPTFPREKGSLFDAHTSIVDMAVAGHYLYTANFGGDEFRVIDVGNPSQPRQVGSYDLPWGAAGGLKVIYPYAYVTDSDGGLRILSVTNPVHPVEVGAYDLSTGVHGPHLAAQNVAVVGNVAYVNVGGNSLHIVNIRYRNAPTKIAEYNAFPAANPKSVKIVDNLAYVADYAAGLDILNVADPSAPRVVGRWVPDDDTFHPLDVAVAGRYAYVLSDFEIDIIDIANPSAPRRVGRYEDPSGGLTYLTVSGHYAYVIVQNSGLMILDVSNPARPTTMVRRYNFNGWPGLLSRPVVHGSKLYVTSNCSLRVLDVSNPAHPIQHTTKEIPGCARDVSIATYPNTSDYYLYIAEEPLHGLDDGGLRIVRMGNMRDVGYYRPPRTNPYDSYRPNFVGVANQRYEAYMIEQSQPDTSWVYTLRLLDLHDRTHPTQIGAISLPEKGGIPAVMADVIFVPAGNTGLMIYRPSYSYSKTIGPGGGNFTSRVDHTSYTFESGTFTHPTTITHTILSPTQAPGTGALIGIGHFYQVSALDTVTGHAVQPGKPYTVVIHYTNVEKGAAIEDSLALYYWNGHAWVKEPTSLVNTAAHTLSAQPHHFSKWAVLGETRRVFLPQVCR